MHRTAEITLTKSVILKERQSQTITEKDHYLKSRNFMRVQCKLMPLFHQVKGRKLKQQQYQSRYKRVDESLLAANSHQSKVVNPPANSFLLKSSSRRMRKFQSVEWVAKLSLFLWQPTHRIRKARILQKRHISQ